MEKKTYLSIETKRYCILLHLVSNPAIIMFFLMLIPHQLSKLVSTQWWILHSIELRTSWSFYHPERKGFEFWIWGGQPMANWPQGNFIRKFLFPEWISQGNKQPRGFYLFPRSNNPWDKCTRTSWSPQTYAIDKTPPSAASCRSPVCVAVKAINDSGSTKCLMPADMATAARVVFSPFTRPIRCD